MVRVEEVTRQEACLSVAFCPFSSPTRWFVLWTSEGSSCFLISRILKWCCCFSGGGRSHRPFAGEREFSTLLHAFAAGTADVVWHVWVLHAEGGTRIGLCYPFGQVRSVWTLTDRVVRGVGPLLELTTAAAVRLPRETLFSFFAAAIWCASVNEMPLSAFIRWTFFSNIHLGQSLLYKQHGMPSSLCIYTRCCMGFRHVQPGHTWHKFLSLYMHFCCDQIFGSWSSAVGLEYIVQQVHEGILICFGTEDALNVIMKVFVFRLPPESSLVSML